MLSFVVSSRLTLLLGPPSSGKTTLLLALAGRLGPGLQVYIVSELMPSFQIPECSVNFLSMDQFSGQTLEKKIL